MVLKGALKSKTIHFNTYLIGAVAIATFIYPELSDYLNQVAVGIGALINIYLRAQTAESLYNKGVSKNEENK